MRPDYQPYEPRTICSHGVLTVEAYRLKTYTISHDGSAIDLDQFTQGIELAAAILPRPGHAEGRPGVGFLIGHRGKGVDYVVIGWWDRENELPVRVFVRKQNGPWRAAAPSESFCVWDLEVIWHERQAYIDTLLSGGGLSTTEAYLADFLGREA